MILTLVESCWINQRSCARPNTPSHSADANGLSDLMRKIRINSHSQWDGAGFKQEAQGDYSEIYHLQGTCSFYSLIRYSHFIIFHFHDYGTKSQKWNSCPHHLHSKFTTLRSFPRNWLKCRHVPNKCDREQTSEFSRNKAVENWWNLLVSLWLIPCFC